MVEGRAIQLHPLVCNAYNADFDGDRWLSMCPVRRGPIRGEILMLSTNNILKPSDGQPVVSPTQDMVIGIYYQTSIKEDAKGKGRSSFHPTRL